LLFNRFFAIVDTCLSCEDIARQSCAMVPRWRIFGDYLRPCEEYKSMVRDKVEEEEWKHLDAQDEKDNDGNSTPHVWNVKRPLQT